MPRTSEIRHYSLLIAALTVSAARAQDPKELARIMLSLAEAYLDIFTLLSHDARALSGDTDLVDALLDGTRLDGARRDGVQA